MVIIIAITLATVKRPVAAHGEGDSVQHVVDWTDHLIMLMMMMVMIMVEVDDVKDDDNDNDNDDED